MAQKKLSSKQFKNAKRPSGKEFRDGLVGEALDDLYADIDGGFSNLEQAAEAALAGGAEPVDLAAVQARLTAIEGKVNQVLVKLRAAGIIAD